MMRWLAAGLALASCAACGAEESPPSEQTVTREVRYGFSARNETNRLLEDAEVRIFAPVRETATQRALAIDASEPFEILPDDLGNQTLRFRLDLPPHGSRTVTIRARVELATRPREASLDDASRYLGPEPLLEVEAPPVQSAAMAAVESDDPLDLSRALTQWVHGRLRATGYRREDRGALWALMQGEGDCTEFARLLAALARARGIPARVLGGFVIERDTVLETGGYHNWAEVHVDGAWRIADPLANLFDTRTETYLAMRVLSPPRPEPLTGSERIRAADGISVSFE